LASLAISYIATDTLIGEESETGHTSCAGVGGLTLLAVLDIAGHTSITEDGVAIYTGCTLIGSCA